MSSDAAASDILSSCMWNTTEKGKSSFTAKDPSQVSSESMRKEYEGSSVGVSLDESATSCNYWITNCRSLHSRSMSLLLY